MLAAAAVAAAVVWGTPAAAAGPYVVTTTANSGAGSLRAAIDYANLHPGTTVSFNLPTALAVSGVFTLKPASPLPTVTAKGTIIDGNSQAAFGGNTNPAGPEVMLSGAAGVSVGLKLTGGNCQVRGLGIGGFTTTGVLVQSASGARVQGCYIGTDAVGTCKAPNGSYGVDVLNGTGAVIGGTTAALRNVLSGNGKSGVLIEGAGATANLVQGNYVGTDPAGTTAIPNAVAGVWIAGGAHGNTVGGAAAGAGNVISGNAQSGVRISGSGTTANLVQGNFIGTDKNGTAALKNGADGVLVEAPADGNTIGGTAAAAKNVISGNGMSGIKLLSAANLVQGNQIGTNVSGGGALSNSEGVLIDGGHHNTIGGTAAGARNLVSANVGWGVELKSGAHHNAVLGNYIGVNASGTAAVGNPGAGVRIVTSANNNTIGGPTAAARNVISGNGYGVWMQGTGVTANVVQGNYIGTNANGGAAVGNTGEGIQLDSSADGNVLGGSGAGMGNLVSGNGSEGISADTSSNLIYGNRVGTNFAGTGAIPNALGGISLGGTANMLGGTGGAGNLISGNGGFGVMAYGSGALVYGNKVGVNAAGTAALPNEGAGLDVRGTNNTIGGAGMGNQVSGNDADGVTVSGGSNILSGNTIGLNAAGTAALPNHGAGVRIEGASNRIGTAGAGNVISGNTQQGLLFTGPLSHNNGAAANIIGLNAAGTGVIANGRDGIALTVSTHANKIGGALATERNVISGNGGQGVYLKYHGVSSNHVGGNYIGTNAAGTAALGNQANGVLIEGDGGDGPSYNSIGLIGRNVISGNGLAGVSISFPGVNHNGVSGNYIGTNAAGSAALPNGRYGVAVLGHLSPMLPQEIGANVISGNLSAGIFMDGPANNPTIEGNIVGLDPSGTAAIPNRGPGIWLYDRINGCRIGGTNANQRNVISGNLEEGIRVEHQCADLTISGNYIGTDGTGLVDRGNGSHGVSISDQSRTANLGGTVSGAGNVISGNGGAGIRFAGTGTKDHLVKGNRIGVNKDGDDALRNSLDGILLEGGAVAYSIGGLGPSARNLISGNLGNGIRLKDAGTSANIHGNYIGTDASGTAGLPNARAGVEASFGAGLTVIGSVTAGYGNRIAFNTQDGVLVRDASTKGITIRGNEIFANGGLGINLEYTGAAGLVTPNDPGDGDSGPNGLQNFPVITGAISTPSVSLSVSLTGFAPSHTFYVDFYYGANGDQDPSGYGQAPHYLGTKVVTTNAGGNAAFLFTDPHPHGGSFYTATATDVSTGAGTSEFSKWRNRPALAIGN